MHYLLVTDSDGEHVLFRGKREALDQLAAKLRRDLPALRIRITRHAIAGQWRAHVDRTEAQQVRDVRAEGWVAPRTG